MAPPQQLAEQAPRYNMSGGASMPPMPAHSMAPPHGPPFYPSMSPAPPPSQPAQGSLSVQTPADPLEQRILDLIYPYRDDAFNTEDENALDEERKILMLCGKVAQQPCHSYLHTPPLSIQRDRILIHYQKTSPSSSATTSPATARPSKSTTCPWHRATGEP